MPKESRFKGKAGTIHVEESDDGEHDVWFEDFCILGTGRSRGEALKDAVRHLSGIGELVGAAQAARMRVEGE